MPTDSEGWLSEIAAAYVDAREALPFAALLGDSDVTEKDLFHIAPMVALKFRGLRRTKVRLRDATDAALCSYVANQSQLDHLPPPLVFAFAYLASHFGLNLLSETEVDGLMESLEQHGTTLQKQIDESERAV